MSVVNRAIEEAIALKAETTRVKAEYAGHEDRFSEERELYSEYQAYCWIMNLLDIDWAKHNSKFVEFTNKIYENGKQSGIRDYQKEDK